MECQAVGGAGMTAPGADRTWERVREELGERVLALFDLDDRDRPAARVLRARAARSAGCTIAFLEHFPVRTRWWSRLERHWMAKHAVRALRRARTSQYPEMAELVSDTVRGTREVLALMDWVKANPEAWLAQNNLLP